MFFCFIWIKHFIWIIIPATRNSPSCSRLNLASASTYIGRDNSVYLLCISALLLKTPRRTGSFGLNSFGRESFGRIHFVENHLVAAYLVEKQIRLKSFRRKTLRQKLFRRRIDHRNFFFCAFIECLPAFFMATSYFWQTYTHIYYIYTYMYIIKIVYKLSTI